MQEKERERIEKAKKREKERKKMKEDMKKVKTKSKSKGNIDFEFVGVIADDEDESPSKSKIDETVDYSREEDKTTSNEDFTIKNLKGQVEDRETDQTGETKTDNEEEVADMIEKRYTDYVLTIEGFLDEEEENVSEDEDSNSFAETPKFINIPSNDERDKVNEEESKKAKEVAPKKEEKKKVTSAPTPDKETTKWDYFAHLTDKYGYETFKKGLDVVAKNNMLRFTEDGEKQIKEEMKKLITSEFDVDQFYSE